jgi:hypothetical protein
LEVPVPWRTLLWVIALILLVVSGLVAYSPNPRVARHAHPTLAFGLAAFVLGWLVHGTLD